MNKELEKKIDNLPKVPGVYFHKDKSGEIIYVGKASNLRNRVRQYFQKSRLRDPKTDVLVKEIVDTDWIELETELDALFVEAEMIRRYMPKFNILLRDDKSFVFVRIDQKADYPSVTLTRRPLDDGATYFGPYTSKPCFEVSATSISLFNAQYNANKGVLASTDWIMSWTRGKYDNHRGVQS